MIFSPSPPRFRTCTQKIRLWHDPMRMQRSEQRKKMINFQFLHYCHRFSASFPAVAHCFHLLYRLSQEEYSFALEYLQKRIRIRPSIDRLSYRLYLVNFSHSQSLVDRMSVETSSCQHFQSVKTKNWSASCTTLEQSGWLIWIKYNACHTLARYLSSSIEAMSLEGDRQKTTDYSNCSVLFQSV